MHRLSQKTPKQRSSKLDLRKSRNKSISTKSKLAKKVTTRSVLQPTRRLFSTTEPTETNETTTTNAAPDILAAEVVKLTHRDLITGAQNGDLLLLKDCLAQEEPKLDLNFKNSYKQTPLILAIKQRHVKSVLFLAKNGADINLPDGQQKMPPFLHVIKKNSVSLFNNFLTLGPDTHVTTPENKSPMTIAGEAGTQIAILNELLGMGFAIDHRDCHGRTPLMYAVRKAKLYEVEWWLNQGANPLSLDKHGKSALDYAKINHDGRILRLVRTRANELNKINRLETADENAAVNEALTRMRAQTRESNKQHQENAKQAKQAAAQAIEKH